MKVNWRDKPRTFEVRGVKLAEMGKISLEADEMVTLVDEAGKECDITAKSWGYYLGPSLNGRLKRQGYKTALVLGESGKIFLHVVDPAKMDDFKAYLVEQSGVVLCWLDEWAGEYKRLN